MAYYESVFLARPDLSAAQADGLVEAFTKSLEEGGGKVTKVENWGLKSLSFKIKKNRKAHYLYLNIDAPAPAVHEVERQMRFHEDVLRYLTLRVDELEEGPSAMLKSRDRDDRPGRRGERGDRDRGDRDRGDRDRGDRGPRRPREDEPRREPRAEAETGSEKASEGESE
jgi:small subunit ribosomal protein S6